MTIAIVKDRDMMGTISEVRKLLRSHGIDSIFEGTGLLYGISVDAGVAKEAAKILRDAPQLRSRRIEIFGDGEIEK